MVWVPGVVCLEFSVKESLVVKIQLERRDYGSYSC